MSLLDDLRGVGEQLVEDAIPMGREAAPILGALIAHLESKGEQLATVELDKLANKFKAPEPPPAGAPPAAAEAGPITTEPPASTAPGLTPEQRVVALEAELAAARQAAQATAPTVNVTSDPPPAA